MIEPDFSKATFKVEPGGGEYTLDAEIRFHLESKDYFATLATILGFIEDITMQHEGRGYPTGPLSSASLRKIRADLVYLHNHYTILPKENQK